MIVIPMAGRSQRFFDAGYAVPKYRLDLNGRSVFRHAVESFAGAADRPFLFITPPADEDAVDFVFAECEAMEIPTFAIRPVDRPTGGQAETVALGIDALGYDGPLTIFNIDTFRPGFAFPTGVFEAADGWLEVFRGSGDNWSYVKPAPGPEPWAAETAEKRPISDLCCTGLYHFARAADFRDALAAERRAPQAPELYVAPLYNHLIRAGRRIAWREIPRDEVIFCGTPAEYEALLAAG